VVVKLMNKKWKKDKIASFKAKHGKAPSKGQLDAWWAGKQRLEEGGHVKSNPKGSKKTRKSPKKKPNPKSKAKLANPDLYGNPRGGRGQRGRPTRGEKPTSAGEAVMDWSDWRGNPSKAWNGASRSTRQAALRGAGYKSTAAASKSWGKLSGTMQKKLNPPVQFGDRPPVFWIEDLGDVPPGHPGYAQPPPHWFAEVPPVPQYDREGGPRFDISYNPGRYPPAPARSRYELWANRAKRAALIDDKQALLYNLDIAIPLAKTQARSEVVFLERARSEGKKRSPNWSLIVNDLAHFDVEAVNPTHAQMSKKARKFISGKISELMEEGYPQKQAVAIAYDMARKKRFKVPEAPVEGNPAELTLPFYAHRGNAKSIYVVKDTEDKVWEVGINMTDGASTFIETARTKKEATSIAKKHAKELRVPLVDYFTYLIKSGRTQKKYELNPKTKPKRNIAITKRGRRRKRLIAAGEREEARITQAEQRWGFYDVPTRTLLAERAGYQRPEVLGARSWEELSNTAQKKISLAIEEVGLRNPSELEFYVEDIGPPSRGHPSRPARPRIPSTTLLNPREELEFYVEDIGPPQTGHPSRPRSPRIPSTTLLNPGTKKFRRSKKKWKSSIKAWRDIGEKTGYSADDVVKKHHTKDSWIFEVRTGKRKKNSGKPRQSLAKNVATARRCKNPCPKSGCNGCLRKQNPGYYSQSKKKANAGDADHPRARAYHKCNGCDKTFRKS
jgi:hypothetical protein